MKSFDIDNSVINSITQNIVSVRIVDDLVFAEVFCAVCQKDESVKRKMKAKRVFYKGGEGSNFGQHLKNVHKLNFRSQASETSDGADEINVNEGESLPLDSAAQLNNALEQNNEVIIENDATNNDALNELNDEKLALNHNFSVEYVEVESDHTKVSNIIFNQISSQIREMVHATLSHNDSLEQMDFNLGDVESPSLKIAEIPGDGSCLFGSIAHQLFRHKINSNEHTRATKQLRKSVVDHISSHYSSFQFELKGRVYESINPTSIVDLSKECKIILQEQRH